MEQIKNPNTIRKSEAQLAFEQVENARRFAVNDVFSRSSPGNPEENTRQNTNYSSFEREQQMDNSKAGTRRDKAPSEEKSESQNVNDNSSHP